MVVLLFFYSFLFPLRDFATHPTPFPFPFLHDGGRRKNLENFYLFKKKTYRDATMKV